MINAGNPMEVITNKLDDILQKLNSLGSPGDGGQDLVQIKKDISAISVSMAALASSVETEEVRTEKQKAMTDAIVDGVNGKIGSLQESMDAFDNKVKQTRFTASLPPGQQQTMNSLTAVLSPDSQKKLSDNLNAYAEQLAKIAVQVSKDKLEESLKSSADDWVKAYRNTIKKEVEDTYEEVERKRDQEGKVIAMSTGTFYILLTIVMCSYSFGFWGATEYLDRNSVLFILGITGITICFVSGLYAWRKFCDWKDKRHRY